MPDLPTQDEVLAYFESLSNWGRWGEDDQFGTMNHITPETRRRAVSLVREGATVSCSRTLSNAPGPDVVAQPVHYMIESGEGYAHDEKAGPPRPSQTSSDFIGVAFHGHTVTHVDSLAHFFFDGVMYNGKPASLVSTRYGATWESIEVLQGGILARGVLLDIPRLRGVPWLNPGEAVLREDLESAEEAQGVRVEPGTSCSSAPVSCAAVASSAPGISPPRAVPAPTPTASPSSTSGPSPCSVPIRATASCTPALTA